MYKMKNQNVFLHIEASFYRPDGEKQLSRKINLFHVQHRKIMQ